MTKEKQEQQPEGTAPADESVDQSVTAAEALAKAKETGAITADLMTRPSFMAAHTAMSFIPDSMKAYGPPHIVPMYHEFRDRVAKVCDGDMTTPEALLICQAMSLNSIYNECASLAGMNIAERLPKAEVLLRMALKAQAQCTQTLRVLGELKNPKAVAFIKQQNNAAGPQQVNNGPVTQGTHAHVSEETQAATNELLTVTDDRESQHAATLDTGATSGAGRSNQTLEAVGAVDGTGE